MSIRSTVKALILHEGKLLVNKCQDTTFGEYYALPGGGQHKYETLEAAIIRECAEETGYPIKPLRLAAVCETIFTDETFRAMHPGYTHRVYHVFLCELLDTTPDAPTEKDEMQLGSEWVAVDTVNASNNIRLFPTAVGSNLLAILAGTAPVFLGSDYKE